MVERLPGAAAGPRVPILMYHSVADDGPAELDLYRVTRDAFRQQMRFLQRQGYHSISLGEWASSMATRRTIPGRPVILTFDDGYRNFYDNAWTILADADLRATIFVVTDRVGGVADWDHVSPPMPLMNWGQLRALQAAGNVIASHCALHRNLVAMDDAAIAADCISAQRALLRELGREVASVAFPWGLDNIRVRRVLAENGYKFAVGVDGGLSSFDDDPMNLPRIEIFGDDDLDAFALKIDAHGFETQSAPAAVAEPRSRPIANPGRGVTVVVTSCGRQDLLERTLDSFFTFNTCRVHRIIVVEDGNGAANDRLAAKYARHQMTWLATGSRVGQIAAIDYAYSLVDTPYLFHLEDDWEFFESGFIEKSLAVLEAMPSCLQVWIRAFDDTMGHPLGDATTTVAGIPVKQAAFGFLNRYHGFTFNPGLRRTADYRRLGKYGFHVTFDPKDPLESECRLSEIYRNLGFCAVILADNQGRGYVRHIGGGRRVRPADGSPPGAATRRLPDAGQHALKPSRLRIIVFGWLIREPLGGMAWHYLNYMHGLAALGHDVFFIEDSGDHPDCYEPGINASVPSTDPSSGLRFAARAFDRLGLGDRWAYFDAHAGEWKGARARDGRALCESADLLLDISGTNVLRDWIERVPVRALIDTDPAFTQVRNLTDKEFRRRCEAHNAFFTFGENIGKACCPVPPDGFPWQPTRQPISLSAWPSHPGPRDGRFTTVMNWQSYAMRRYRGLRLAMKSESFPPFISLPQRLGDIFTIALRSSREVASAMRASGWALADIAAVAADPWSYQQFIQGSKGEFGIAKQGYVSTYCGWFSERSAAYLASGRPVLAQDTGFREWLPTGRGVLSFQTAEDVVNAVGAIDADYAAHCRAARELAQEYFAAHRVLPDLIDRANFMPALALTA